jgi:hypothetical protein
MQHGVHIHIASVLGLCRRIALADTTVKKRKAIPVTGSGGPYDCETSRLSHFLDNGLTDGSEVVSLTRRSPFTPRNIPGTHFC